jgi:hypothetical protein
MNQTLEANTSWDRAPDVGVNVFATLFPFWWFGYKGLWSVLWTRVIPSVSFVSCMAMMSHEINRQHMLNFPMWPFFGVYVIGCIIMGRRANEFYRERATRQPRAFEGVGAGLASTLAYVLCTFFAAILATAFV